MRLDTGVFFFVILCLTGTKLGDKSNHIPVLHITQMFYFLGFATVFGWHALVSGPGGPIGLLKEVLYRMFGSKR